MKVFVAGATGVLGCRVVRQLVARGHQVVGLARRPENEVAIASLGGEPARADLFDADSLARAASGCDVVVRAATAIPPGFRWSRKAWETNDRIRREGTTALTACAAKVGANAYVQESIVWLAAPADGAQFDETAPTAPRLWYQSAADAESIATTAGAASGVQVATLRFGGFYGPDSRQTRDMGARLVRRRLPIIGDGTALWSNVHLDDAASALIAAIEAGRGGLWHVVDDRPTSSADFIHEFAHLLGAPEPRSVPAWLASLFVGRDAVAFATASTRTSNAKIRRELGWSPRYPTTQEGLRQVVDAWKAEGFPPR